MPASEPQIGHKNPAALISQTITIRATEKMQAKKTGQRPGITKDSNMKKKTLFAAESP